jgi:hypothetical protein
MRFVAGVLLLGGIALTTVACDSDPTGPDPEKEGAGGRGFEAGVLAAVSGVEGSLVNGDMEIEAGWWFYGPSEGERGYSTTNARSGARSIALSHPSPTGTSQFSYAAQYMRTEDPTETTFKFTVRLRLEGVTGPGVAIALRGDTEETPAGSAEAFSTTQGVQTYIGTGEWMEVTVQLGDLDERVQSITACLLLLSGSSGTVYFDDAELSSSNSTPILTLRNGDFESGTLWPLHWWRGGLGYSGFHFGWLDVPGWEGDHAVSIARDQASSTDFGFWAQTIFANDFRGGSATLRALIKTDLEGAGVCLTLRGDDTPHAAGNAEVGESTCIESPVTGFQDWAEHSVTLAEVPNSIKSLTVYLLFIPNTTGTASFDAVTLTPG